MLKHIAILILVLFLTQSNLNAKEELKSEISNQEVYRQFQAMFEKVNKEYVEVPNKQKMVDAAIEGMITSLDPHCNYLTDEDLKDFKHTFEGEFGGIGVEIMYEKGAIKIISPIDDLPADKAGIKAGDFIVKVNDELVSNLGFHKSVREMRGTPGTKVKITVVNDQESKLREVELVREIVKLNPVKSRLFENIVYIRIVTFSKKTFEEFTKAFDKLKAQSNNNIAGVVLDLRNNPGGSLKEAINISNYFLESGTIVSVKGRSPSSHIVSTVNKFGNQIPNVPIVALINSGSASASEIVAGALQDHKRAIIMGTKSFGKGSVQTFEELSPRTGLSITTALYYTPSGKSIQAEGIEPDILVEPAKIEYSKNENILSHYSEAKLKGALKNQSSKAKEKDDEQGKKKADKPDEQLKQQIENNPAKKEVPKTSTSENTMLHSNVPEDLYQKDFQFARAFDLVKAMILINKK